MYVAWTFFACGTIFLAAFLTQNISPHAIGSGIPQMKVRGSAPRGGAERREVLRHHQYTMVIVGATLTRDSSPHPLLVNCPP